MTALGRWVIGYTALVLVLVGACTAHADFTTEVCLAKKLKEWGKLRNCQATESGKALRGKPADPTKCLMKFEEKLTKLNEKAMAAEIKCRYRVNGDGTATDYDTGLQWEQKTDDGTVHDKDNTYRWSTLTDAPDGPAFYSFLGTLNDCRSLAGDVLTGGFAGHCDWRFPTIVELQQIVDCSVGNPCIDPAIFGPTATMDYWSATTCTAYPYAAWVVDFINPSLPGCAGKTSYDAYARAVRAAL